MIAALQRLRRGGRRSGTIGPAARALLIALSVVACGDVAGLEPGDGTVTFVARIATEATCDGAGVEAVEFVAQRIACPVGEDGDECVLGEASEESRQGTGISCPAAAAFTDVAVDVDLPGTYRVEARLRASDSSVEQRCLRTSAGDDPVVTRDDLSVGATIGLELQPVGACPAI